MIYKKTYYYFKSALSHKLCDDIIKCGFSLNPNIALTGDRKPRNKIEHSHVMKLRKSSTSWIDDVWLKKELNVCSIDCSSVKCLIFLRALSSICLTLTKDIPSLSAVSRKVSCPCLLIDSKTQFRSCS